MEITNAWLDSHKAGGSSWTYAQLEAIGVPIPPKKGWKSLVIGKEIPESTAELFIKAKSIKHRGRPVRRKRINHSPASQELPLGSTSPRSISIQSRRHSSDPGERIMGLKKFNGRKIKDVPVDYLHWCIRENAGDQELLSDIAAFLADQRASSENWPEGIA